MSKIQDSEISKHFLNHNSDLFKTKKKLPKSSRKKPLTFSEIEHKRQLESLNHRISDIGNVYHI